MYLNTVILNIVMHMEQVFLLFVFHVKEKKKKKEYYTQQIKFAIGVEKNMQKQIHLPLEVVHIAQKNVNLRTRRVPDTKKGVNCQI